MAVNARPEGRRCNSRKAPFFIASPNKDDLLVLRDLVEEGRVTPFVERTISGELGFAYGLAEAHFAGSELEHLAGDLAMAERELREAIRVAHEMGASR